MILLVGLGNPGIKYQRTRHNLGFMVVDQVAEDLNLSFEKNDQINGLVAKSNQVIILKPLTYMNDSGFAVSKAMRFFKIKVKEVWVVHDEVDIPRGKIKISWGGGAAGHRGIGSILEQINESLFVRFRLGIGHPRDAQNSEMPVERYVLEKMQPDEVKTSINIGVEAIKTALKIDVETAMARYNS